MHSRVEAARKMHVREMHFSDNFSERIAVQLASGGVIGVFSDKVVGILLSMLASLVVGFIMEFYKMKLQQKDQKQSAQPSKPASATGNYCATPRQQQGSDKTQIISAEPDK